MLPYASSLSKASYVDKQAQPRKLTKRIDDTDNNCGKFQFLELIKQKINVAGRPTSVTEERLKEHN